VTHRLLSASIVLTLAACGGSGDDPDPAATQAADARERAAVLAQRACEDALFALESERSMLDESLATLRNARAATQATLDTAHGLPNADPDSVAAFEGDIARTDGEIASMSADREAIDTRIEAERRHCAALAPH